MSTATLTPPARPRAKLLPPPPLEAGDHLSVTEFLRRYEAATDVKKAQLIEGTVHMPSPVRADLHGEPDGIIQTLLGVYASNHRGLKLYPNTTLLLDGSNAPQPDAMLCSTPRAHGRVWLNANGYLCGAPELVCEIAASSVSVDLHEKKRAYCRAGVQEYLVWLTQDRKVLWYSLTEGEYQPQPADNKGLIRSLVFPGLVLDTRALLKHDAAKVLAALRG